MSALRVYEKIADTTVAALWDSHLDLDRFLPALHEAMLERVREVQANPDDWEVEDQNYADNQECDARLFREALLSALAELNTAIVQTLPSDDQIIVGHMKAAVATLQNLKRLMEH